MKWILLLLLLVACKQKVEYLDSGKSVVKEIDVKASYEIGVIQNSKTQESGIERCDYSCTRIGCGWDWMGAEYKCGLLVWTDCDGQRSFTRYLIDENYQVEYKDDMQKTYRSPIKNRFRYEYTNRGQCR